MSIQMLHALVAISSAFSVGFSTTEPAVNVADQSASKPPSISSYMPKPRPGATDSLSFLDGIWIGPAKMTLPTGQTVEFEQMERIGPMLGGEIRLMEGKARNTDGTSPFNALTVFTADAEGQIQMRSHVPGNVSSRSIKVRPDGFSWQMQVGSSRIDYDARIQAGVWYEVGTRTGPDGAPVKFFEMRLTRRGDTDWPNANPQFQVTP